MAAAMVMSFLNKKVRVEGMNMHGLGSMLQRESTTIRNALPPGLADVFWPATVRSTSPVVAQAVKRERPLFRWLLLLALLAMSIPGVLWLLNHARKPIVPPVAPVRTEVPPVTTETTPLGTANRAATDSVDIVKRALLNNADLRFDARSARLRPEPEVLLRISPSLLQGIQTST
jgi:hypothetical protein